MILTILFIIMQTRKEYQNGHFSDCCAHLIYFFYGKPGKTASLNLNKNMDKTKYKYKKTWHAPAYLYACEYVLHMHLRISSYQSILFISYIFVLVHDPEMGPFFRIIYVETKLRNQTVRFSLSDDILGLFCYIGDHYNGE